MPPTLLNACFELNGVILSLERRLPIPCLGCEKEENIGPLLEEFQILMGIKILFVRALTFLPIWKIDVCRMIYYHYPLAHFSTYLRLLTHKDTYNFIQQNMKR